nr:MAG TPA: hypothetical protein [Caudoviricetes sp.]
MLGNVKPQIFSDEGFRFSGRNIDSGLLFSRFFNMLNSVIIAGNDVVLLNVLPLDGVDAIGSLNRCAFKRSDTPFMVCQLHGVFCQFLGVLGDILVCLVGLRVQPIKPGIDSFKVLGMVGNGSVQPIQPFILFSVLRVNAVHVTAQVRDIVRVLGNIRLCLGQVGADGIGFGVESIKPPVLFRVLCIKAGNLCRKVLFQLVDPDGVGRDFFGVLLNIRGVVQNVLFVGGDIGLLGRVTFAELLDIVLGFGLKRIKLFLRCAVAGLVVVDACGQLFIGLFEGRDIVRMNFKVGGETVHLSGEFSDVFNRSVNAGVVGVGSLLDFVHGGLHRVHLVHGFGDVLHSAGHLSAQVFHRLLNLLKLVIVIGSFDPIGRIRQISTSGNKSAGRVAIAVMGNDDEVFIASSLVPFHRVGKLRNVPCADVLRSTARNRPGRRTGRKRRMRRARPASRSARSASNRKSVFALHIQNSFLSVSIPNNEMPPIGVVCAGGRVEVQELPDRRNVGDEMPIIRQTEENELDYLGNHCREICVSPFRERLLFKIAHIQPLIDGTLCIRKRLGVAVQGFDVSARLFNVAFELVEKLVKGLDLGNNPT